MRGLPIFPIIGSAAFDRVPSGQISLPSITRRSPQTDRGSLSPGMVAWGEAGCHQHGTQIQTCTQPVHRHWRLNSILLHQTAKQSIINAINQNQDTLQIPERKSLLTEIKNVEIGTLYNNMNQIKIRIHLWKERVRVSTVTCQSESDELSATRTERGDDRRVF